MPVHVSADDAAIFKERLAAVCVAVGGKMTNRLVRGALSGGH